LLAVLQNGLAVEIEGRVANSEPFEPGPSHATSGPFGDQTAFELGDGSDHRDQGPAQRTTSVDLLSEAYELDA
jgi:hypothetical protein